MQSVDGDCNHGITEPLKWILAPLPPKRHHVEFTESVLTYANAIRNIVVCCISFALHFVHPIALPFLFACSESGCLKEKMNSSSLVSTSMILHVVIAYMSGICFAYRWKASSDNCTCIRNGLSTYSLFSLRGQRIYGSGFRQHASYTYTFMPCVPDNLHSREGNCSNVALCEHDTNRVPPVFIDLGEQGDVICEETNEYKFALMYPLKKGSHSISHSKVVVECDNDPNAKPVLNLISEDNLTFSLKTFCGCPSQCSATETNKTATFGDIVRQTRLTTISTKERPKSTPGDSSLSLVTLALHILVPCLGTFFLILISLCLWWHHVTIKNAVMRLRCCQCCDGYDVLEREGRTERVTESSRLFRNQQSYRAVGEEDSVVKGPEDGVAKQHFELIRKDNKTAVV